MSFKTPISRSMEALDDEFAALDALLAARRQLG